NECKHGNGEHQAERCDLPQEIASESVRGRDRPPAVMAEVRIDIESSRADWTAVGKHATSRCGRGSWKKRSSRSTIVTGMLWLHTSEVAARRRCSGGAPRKFSDFSASISVEAEYYPIPNKH